MKRLGLFGVVAGVVVACSHPAPPVTPLPPDPARPTPTADATPTPTPPPPPAKPPAPAAPAPHDTEIAADQTTVKLVSPGKGKRVVLKIAPAAGGKMPIEMHTDLVATQGGVPQQTPTLILRGDVQIATVDKDGTHYAITMSGADTHYPATLHRLAPLEAGLAGIVGMTITGTVASNGISDKLALHHDAATPDAMQMMELMKQTWLPSWPALPTEAIAPGAKWQATTAFKLFGQVDVTETVDYELVAYKAKTWTIKGTAKVTGAEQTQQGATITNIAGSGSVEATLVDGAFVPTLHHKLSATFDAVAGNERLGYALELGKDIGVDSSQLPFAPDAGSGAAPATAPAAK